MNPTNASIQEMIAEMGERMLLIAIDNQRKLIFGSTAHDEANIVNVGDLEFKTWGGVDYIGIPRADKVWGGKVVKYHSWFVTAYIQYIMTLDVDPAVDPTMPDMNKIF